MKEAEYNSLVDMFESLGWQSFMKNVSDLEDMTIKAAADHAVSNDQWQYCRGQVHQLRSLLGYENFIKASYEQQELAKLEDQEADEGGVDVDFI